MGRSLDDIMIQEQLPNSKLRTSANASDNGTIPWFTASSYKGTTLKVAARYRRKMQLLHRRKYSLQIT
jgi:hypothetical protein